MAQPGPSSSTDAHQGAGANPEAPWIPFIKEHYPNLLKQTHFFPPIHFNRTPCVVENIAGQTVHIRDNPNPRRRRHQPAVPAPVWDAGMVFTQNSPHSQDVHVPPSDQQDDCATQSCLSALFNILNQVMMVISSLKFKKYLDNRLNPLHAAAIAQLPTIQDPSLPQQIQDGECDIVIIHRHYGLLVGEIKSVGASGHFQSQPPEKQTSEIKKKVERALKQLQNQEAALRQLVSDLPPVRIIKAVMLPNITSRQLRKLLDSDASLLQRLCQVLSLSNDVTQAVSHCLCQEDLSQPDVWWQGLHTAGNDPFMTEDLYQRLVARFCGPATTVDVPTAGTPRKVLRSLAQAVAETGLRLSSLALTPAQVALLSRQPEPQYMYLWGPPGTGKTICLLLKSLQWAQQDRRVVIVSGSRESRAVSLLLKEQLTGLLGPAAAADNIQQHLLVFREDDFDARAAVAALRQQMGPGPFSLLYDEVVLDYRVIDRYMQWLTEIRSQLPDVTVWTAGIYRLDRHPTVSLPTWLKMHTLQEALRSPSTVTTVLQQSVHIQDNYTPQYTAPQHPVATQGPPVQQVRHEGHAGHTDCFPRQCDTCIHVILDILTKQLRVGQPDHGLQYRDVFILYGFEVPRAGDVMVERLQGHGLPVRVISDPPSEDDTRELALAVSDVITVAGSDAVQGLERRVVIALGTGEDDMSPFFLPATSRCSGSLYIIN